MQAAMTSSSSGKPHYNQLVVMHNELDIGPYEACNNQSNSSHAYLSLSTNSIG